MGGQLNDLLETAGHYGPRHGVARVPPFLAVLVIECVRYCNCRRAHCDYPGRLSRESEICPDDHGPGADGRYCKK